MGKKFLIIFIVTVLLFSFGIRLYRLTEPNHYYFDEVYHAVTAKAYADNRPEAYDPFSPAPKEGTAYDWLHPPLAKLIQAGSIKIFGDVPLGWRLPSVIFGTGIIALVFFLALRLLGPTVAVFATLVIAFENLTFVMSRITMNDVFVTFFALAAFLFATLYVSSGRHSELVSESRDSIAEFTLNKRSRSFADAQDDKSEGLQNGRKGGSLYLVLTAIFLGLAVASKWTGLYAVAAVFVYFLWDQVINRRINLVKFLPLFILPPVIYLAAYGQFWLQGHSVQQFIDLHKQIWWYQNTRNLKHSYATTPLYCVPEGLDGLKKAWCPWALDVRGVYFSYEAYGEGRAGYIYALGNPLIFWIGFVAVFYLIGKFLEERKKEYALVLLGYFIFWVPFIFSPRILFFYHYLPSVPFLSIALSVFLKDMYFSKFKIIAILILAAFIVTFFYFYPISSGYPIKAESIGNYMWLKTWR